MKVQIKGIVHKDKQFNAFTIFASDMSKYGYLVVGPIEIDYDVPASFNPVAAEVATLNAQLEAINAKHQSEVRFLKGRIAELLCIENAPTAGAA